MEIKGKLIQIFELKSGTSKATNKDWKIQEFLISSKSGEYENKVKLQTSKDLKYPIGAELTCQINIKASEYQGKWYNSIDAWKIESNSNEMPNSQEEYVTQRPIDNYPNNEPFDDSLPF